jgi:hypothetical protein
VGLGELAISSAGTTVTVANVSAGTFAVAVGGAGAAALTGTRAFFGGAFLADLATGLGVVTTISGN